jgi:lipopolysaccharide transport system ATP-binding protein
MSDVILSVENVSKLYRLGTVGTGTFGGDVQRFWKTKILGQEDPFLKIGQTNDRTSKEKAEFVWALQDINFEVKRGEVLGIIGKNGAGKSTLLKLLSRITSPTKGSIKSAGRMASLLEVGTGFHPELTGRENIYLNGAILGMTKREIQSKFDEIVDFSGCELYIDTPTKRYSSGMTVRLGFAVAAFLDPEILVVDEVLAVGDAEFQKKAIGKMQDVSRGEGKTVLFVSHNMGAVKNLCKTGLVMNNGRTIFHGDVDSAIVEYGKGNKIVGEDSDKVDASFENTNNLPVFIENVVLLVNGIKADSNSIDFMDKIGFELEIRVLKKVKNRGVVIHCKDENERIFSVFDISQYPENFDGRELGLHKVTVDLNHPLFCEGKYSFDFEIGHFGVGPEQLQENALNLLVEVLSRNPRFEPATKNRNNKVFIEPKWEFNNG